MKLPSIKFRRITSSGDYIPEMDGLRFLGLIFVVGFHLRIFLMEKDTHSYLGDGIGFELIDRLISNGAFALPLFFIMSGYILGVPFASHRMGFNKGVKLKSYFLRRLTRIEPPYFVALLLFFVANVLVVKKIAMDEGIRSLIASFFYVHNFAYGKDTLPLLLEPAWSLEVEVQFYFLAPLLALLYTLKNQTFRRWLWIGLTVFFIAFDYLFELPFRSLLNYFEFFLLGMFFADLKVGGYSFKPKKTWFTTLIAWAACFCIWLYRPIDFEETHMRFLWDFTRVALSTVFFHYLFLMEGSRLLSLRWATNIGGMCYSIYLLHYAVISFFGNPIMQFQFSQYRFFNLAIYSALILFAVWAVSSVYYLLIERPCMDKQWPKKLAQFLGFKSSSTKAQNPT